MAALDITGQVPVEIDHTFAITCTRVSVRRQTPSQFKAGAFGPIGIAQGFGPVTVNLSFAVPKTGMEFSIEDLRKKAGGITISITLAPGKKKLILGCKPTDDSYDNDPAAGSTDVPWVFMGTEMVDG